MFIEIHTRAKGSKNKYTPHLFNIDKVSIMSKFIEFTINGIEQEIKESYNDIKKMLDKHNLLITK